MLDVGSGDDPLPGALAFDRPDGSGDDLTKFGNFAFMQFDTIHASQVLEHALSPEVMLRSWIDCLKPGGYIVATVPDYALYEKKQFPSKWNAGHRSTWSLDFEKRISYHPNGQGDCGNPKCPTCYAPHIKLPEWLNQFLNTDKPCELLLCRLIDTSNHSLSDDVDQTFPADGAEVFIEFVLRKKE